MKADKSLADGMHRRLRRDIIDGRLQAGAKLKLEGLAADYAVGMSPLREALSRLIGESLVVSESQRGFWVAPLSMEELDDLTRVRLLIECEALSLSFRNGDAAWELRVTHAYRELARVEQAHGDEIAVDSGSVNAWEHANDEFHFALIDACHSPVLITLRERLYYQSERYRRISSGVAFGRRRVNDEHTALYEAAMRHDASNGHRLMEHHLIETAASVRRALAAGVPGR